MKESIIKDLNWIEDWGGYSTVISQFNPHKSAASVKVFIQKENSDTWAEIPLIPSVSAYGYAYSWVHSLRIFYLGNEIPEKMQIKVDYGIM